MGPPKGTAEPNLARLEELSNLWMDDKWAHLDQPRGLEDLKYFIYLIPGYWPHNLKRMAHKAAGANLAYCLDNLQVRSSHMAGEELISLLYPEDDGHLPVESMSVGPRPIDPRQTGKAEIDQITSTLRAMEVRHTETNKQHEAKIAELTTSIGKLVRVMEKQVEVQRQAGPGPKPPGSVSTQVSRETTSRSVKEATKAPPATSSIFGPPQAKVLVGKRMPKQQPPKT